MTSLSTRNSLSSGTYDLRFVTQDMARRRIKAAMKQSRRVRLTVGKCQDVQIKSRDETYLTENQQRRTTRQLERSFVSLSGNTPFSLSKKSVLLLKREEPVLHLFVL